MAGNNNNIPKFETPVVFTRTQPTSLDDSFVIDSLSVLSDQIPVGIRYIGQLFYVVDEKKYYCFKEGLNDVNAEPLIIGDGVNKLVITIDEIITNNYVVTHNLNTANLVMDFMLNNEKVLLDYTIDDLNYITIHIPNNGSVPTGLKIVFVF